MKRKDSIDLTGALGMVGFASLLAFNQVVVKVTNGGLGPVFGAGLRSVLALGVLLIWCALMRRRITGLRHSLWPGLGLGLLFSVEFMFLFVSLDLTTVSRASILFYSMPVCLAVIAHFSLPNERLSKTRVLGLVLAMGGVIWAFADPQSRGAGDWRGDVLAVLAALSWAGIALLVRLTRMAQVQPETQLFWQLSVSSVVLIAVAPLFGPIWRDPQLIHWLGMGYQSVFVASLGFLFWLRIMSIYPASDVAAFSFLSPILAVGLGWAVLDEPVGPGFVGALALVSVGIVLINRRRKPKIG